MSNLFATFTLSWVIFELVQVVAVLVFLGFLIEYMTRLEGRVDEMGREIKDLNGRLDIIATQVRQGLSRMKERVINLV